MGNTGWGGCLGLREGDGRMTWTDLWLQGFVGGWSLEKETRKGTVIGYWTEFDSQRGCKLVAVSLTTVENEIHLT